MVVGMRSVLRRSLEASQPSLHRVINIVWPHSGASSSRSFSALSFECAPNEWFLSLVIGATPQTKQQRILYHLLEGHLLIDGQPLGKLPAEHRHSIIIEQLFGTRNLLTWPSGLHDMSYQLAFDMNGHIVHIGFRNGTIIVRAWVRGALLEFIPRAVFGLPKDCDLPASLINGCVHWLDLRTGLLEIRQEPDIWVSKQSNWILDYSNRRALRRTSTLVDRHSPVFRHIASIFDRFEYSQNLTVFQP